MYVYVLSQQRYSKGDITFVTQVFWVRNFDQIIWTLPNLYKRKTFFPWDEILSLLYLGRYFNFLHLHLLTIEDKKLHRMRRNNINVHKWIPFVIPYQALKSKQLQVYMERLISYENFHLWMESYNLSNIHD